jgi:uncharacterized membrane protein
VEPTRRRRRGFASDRGGARFTITLAVIEQIVNSAISFLVPCAIIAVVSIPLMLNVVPPNRVYGFRTQQTLSNRELWFRANRFAGCALFIASGTSGAIFAAQPEYASGRSLVGLVVFLVPLVAALVASFAYVRRIGGGGKR